MTQKRTWDFGADDDTLAFNESKLAQLPAGVYQGFRATLGSSGGLKLAFRHDPHPSAAKKKNGVDGATGAPGGRVLTSAAGGFNAAVALGDLLRVDDREAVGDNGDYIVIARNDTTITVDRDWPQGNLSGLDFTVYKPLGVLRTPAGVVVAEDSCQNDVLDVDGGGARYRYDRVICRYIYNAADPPNVASYIVLKGAVSRAVVADGVTSAVATRQFSSVIGGFNAAVARGDFLRIDDASTPQDDGDYEVLEVLDDTTLLIDRDWPAGSLTGLSFSVYRFPAATENDVLIATLLVKAGIVALSQELIYQAKPISLVNESLEQQRLSLFEPGVYIGCVLKPGSLGTKVSIEKGSVLLPSGAILDVTAAADVVTAALAAGGFHRYSKIFIGAKLRAAGLDTYEIFEVGGTAVADSTEPALPTAAQIAAVLETQFAQGDYTSSDIIELGTLLITDAIVTIFSAGRKIFRNSSIRVSDGRRGWASRGADYYGPAGLVAAVADLYALTDESTSFDIDPAVRAVRPPRRILLDGAFDLPGGSLIIPSGIALVGAGDGAPAVIVSGTGAAVFDISIRGLAFVGNDVDATWTAVLQADPADLPAGYKLFRLTLAGVQQVGTKLNEYRASRWDPVRLRYDAAGSMTGWVYTVQGDWVIDVLLPDTYDTAKNKGDLKLLKRSVWLEKLQLDASVGLENAEDCVIRDCWLSTLQLWQHQGCRFESLRFSGTGAGSGLREAGSAVDFPGLSRYPNWYSDIYVHNADFVTVAGSEGSSYRGIRLIGTTGLLIWSIAEPRCQIADIYWESPFNGQGLTLNAAGGRAALVKAGSSNHANNTLTVTPSDFVLADRVDANRKLINWDRNTRITSSANLTWNSSTGILAWDGTIFFDLPDSTWKNQVVAGQATLSADDKYAYVTLQRAPGATQSLAITVASKPVTLTDDILILARRAGGRIFLWDGTQIAHGATIKIGEVTVSDGSVTYEKLAGSAHAYQRAALGDFVLDATGNLCDPAGLIFHNTGLLGFTYDSNNGWVTYTAKPASIADADPGDIFVDGVGRRFAIQQITTNAGTTRLHIGKGLTVNNVVADKFDGMILRGRLVRQNVDLVAFTYTDSVTDYDDGSTVAPLTLTKLGASFLTTARAGAELLVQEATAGERDDNGAYVVASVTNDTTLLVTRDWPVGGKTVDVRIQFGQIQFAAGVNLSMVKAGYLLRDAAGKEHIIRAVDDANDRLIVDYGSAVTDSAPVTAADGAVYADTNPRGLSFDDFSVRQGIERLRLCETSSVRELGPRNVYTRRPMPASGIGSDPRVRLYGDWGSNLPDQDFALSARAFLNTGRLYGQEAQITFYGTGCLPLLRDGVVEVYVDGAYVLDLDASTKKSQAWTRSADCSRFSPTYTDYLQKLVELPLGIHTMTLRSKWTDAADVRLEGYDIFCKPQGGEFVEMPGQACVSGKFIEKTSRTISSNLPDAGTKGSRVVRYLRQDGTTEWAETLVRERTVLEGDVNSSDTISNVTPSPLDEGYKVGDLLLIEGVGGEEVHAIKSLTSTTIVLLTSVTFTEADVSLTFRGQTTGTAFKEARPKELDRSLEESVYYIPLPAFGAGETNDFLGLGLSSADPSYQMEDGAQVLTGEDCSMLRMSTAHPKRVVTHLRTTSPSGLTFTFVGTGLRIRLVPYEPNTYVTSYARVTLDGTPLGIIAGDSGPVVDIDIAADLPYGSHVVRIEPESANSGLFLEGFEVFQPKTPTHEGLALAVANRPQATPVASRLSTLLDPGDGWIRYHCQRLWTFLGVWTGAGLEENPGVYRGGWARLSNDIGDFGRLAYIGGSAIIWGDDAGGFNAKWNTSTGLALNAVVFSPSGAATLTSLLEIEVDAAIESRIECADLQVVFHHLRQQHFRLVGNRSFCDSSDGLEDVRRRAPVMDTPARVFVRKAQGIISTRSISDADEERVYDAYLLFYSPDRSFFEISFEGAFYHSSAGVADVTLYFLLDEVELQTQDFTQEAQNKQILAHMSQTVAVEAGWHTLQVLVIAGVGVTLRIGNRRIMTARRVGRAI